MPELQGWVELPLSKFASEPEIIFADGRVLMRADAFGRMIGAYQEAQSSAALLRKLGAVIAAKDAEAMEKPLTDVHTEDELLAARPYCPECGSGEKARPAQGVTLCPHPWHLSGGPQTDAAAPEPLGGYQGNPLDLDTVHRALLGWMGEPKNYGQKLPPGKYSVSAFYPWVEPAHERAETCDLTVREDGALVTRSGRPAVVPAGYGAERVQVPEGHRPA